MLFCPLIRDQEVGGSNPLAPTNYFAISNLRTRKWSSSVWSQSRGGRSYPFAAETLSLHVRHRKMDEEKQKLKASEKMKRDFGL